MSDENEILRKKTQSMIDSILRRGGNSVRCNELDCTPEEVVDLYEKRGWRVSKSEEVEPEDSVLLFETAVERKLLKG